jgi:hypothetical protein
MPKLYHVTTRTELEAARRTGHLAPPSLAEQGFVHACFREQIAGVLQRYFRGASGLALLELERSQCGRVRIESAPGASEGFPHVYGALPLAAVTREFALERAQDGEFELPRELRNEAARERVELDALLAAYAWYDHPEGPKFVETHRDEHRTSGHWLFLPGAISAFHRVLDSEELWIAQRGRLTVYVIDERGALTEHALGNDVAAGETPVLAIPRGLWQAAELPAGEPFAFGTNVCAPGFCFERFELARRAALSAEFPRHRAWIERLTHG